MKTFASVLVGSMVIMLLFSLAVPAFAQTRGQIPGPIVAQAGPTTIAGWVGILITVVQWFYTIVFIVAVFFILLAAYNFITSSGDPKKTETAKNQLKYAAIGIAVALLSYGIVTLIQRSIQSNLQV